MDEIKIQSPLRAIKEKCMDCCCWQREAVKSCACTDCALHAFRFGKNPYRAKRQLTEEQRQAAAERLLKSRKSKERKETND